MTKLDIIKGLEDILYCGELDLYENEKRIIKDAIFFLKYPEVDIKKEIPLKVRELPLTREEVQAAFSNLSGIDGISEIIDQIYRKQVSNHNI